MHKVGHQRGSLAEGRRETQGRHQTREEEDETFTLLRRLLVSAMRARTVAAPSSPPELLTDICALVTRMHRAGLMYVKPQRLYAQAEDQRMRVKLVCAVWQDLGLFDTEAKFMQAAEVSALKMEAEHTTRTAAAAVVDATAVVSRQAALPEEAPAKADPVESGEEVNAQWLAEWKAALAAERAKPHGQHANEDIEEDVSAEENAYWSAQWQAALAAQATLPTPVQE
jgi:hypothetical protein